MKRTASFDNISLDLYPTWAGSTGRLASTFKLCKQPWTHGINKDRGYNHCSQASRKPSAQHNGCLGGHRAWGDGHLPRWWAHGTWWHFLTLFFQTPSLRTVGNIVTGTDHQTQLALDAGILAVLPQLLTHPRSSIQKEAAWALSNVAAGPRQHIQQLIACGALPPLVAVLENVSGPCDKRLPSNGPCVELL